jgi:succinyl-CoA synthetase beta subunit
LKLYEHEAKNILSKHGVLTPQGGLASTAAKAREIASKLKMPVAVKAQVLVAGRGKAGGILFARSAEEAEKVAEHVLGMHVKGIPVKSVWIEEKLDIKKELYLGITIDRFNRRYVVIASSVGGVDVEEVASKTPEKMTKTLIEPQLGLKPFQAREVARKMGYAGNQISELGRVIEKLYAAGMSIDAELIEMNPLVETTDCKFIAADARIIIDDNALFRHPEYKNSLLEGEGDLSSQELEAINNDLAYVKLEGDIGVMGNGAGLVMATLDTIEYFGGKPANFLDVGGGATAEKNAVAMRIVLSDPHVKVLLINILGGITRCDEVAKGVLEAKQKVGVTKPMVIRLVGTNEEEGRKILTDAGIPVLSSMEEAAQRAIQIAGTGES